MTGRVILLIGTSSAGKSTLARELQEVLREPYLWVSLDAFFAMAPKPWGGARGGPKSHDGFRYDEIERDGARVTRIVYGEYGWRLLTGMHDAVAALAHGGLDIVVDDMLLDQDVLTDWERALRGLDVLVVRVGAPLQILEVRERDRNGRIGLARGHLVDNERAPADLVIDTSVRSPQEAARMIVDFDAPHARSWLA